MDKDQILAILRAHEPELQKWGIRHAGLFGSVARGEELPDSDIDILIELEPDDKRGVWGYAGIKRRVAELFSGEVDVVDRGHLREHVHEAVEKDLIYAF